MVMHRDEEEVFDDAIHVFFDKQYYDAYISKAKKYSDHEYSYHDDKLGDIIYQIFDEKIPGMVLHMSTQDKMPGNILCDEKYLSAKDLMPIKETVENYHYLYLASIQRMDKNETIAKLWTRNVFIIGQLPDFRVKENQRVELMTLRRKKDGTPAIGTIAQEIQNTYPELTKTYRNFEGEERLTVNYSGLVGVLIEAVKELSGKVKELSQEIEQLKHNEDR